jgi:hypothetical protein
LGVDEHAATTSSESVSAAGNLSLDLIGVSGV